jgi:cell volume regulation protein A
MARIEVTDSGTDLFHMVFFIVLVSILLQGTLLPYMARRLSMIDAKEDVRKTFSDYSEEMPLQFVEICVQPGHRWAGTYIRDIVLPPDTLFVQMTREGESISTTGDTKIEPGDVMVLSARTPKLNENLRFTELLLENGHKWIGKTISELNLEAGRLVILIKRGEEIVIPKGDTSLMCEDKLVIKEVV